MLEYDFQIEALESRLFFSATPIPASPVPVVQAPATMTPNTPITYTVNNTDGILSINLDTSLNVAAGTYTYQNLQSTGAPPALATLRANTITFDPTQFNKMNAGDSLTVQFSLDLSNGKTIQTQTIEITVNAPQLFFASKMSLASVSAPLIKAATISPSITTTTGLEELSTQKSLSYQDAQIQSTIVNEQFSSQKNSNLTSFDEAYASSPSTGPAILLKAATQKNFHSETTQFSFSFDQKKLAIENSFDDSDHEATEIYTTTKLNTENLKFIDPLINHSEDIILDYEIEQFLEIIQEEDQVLEASQLRQTDLDTRRSFAFTFQQSFSLFDL